MIMDLRVYLMKTTCAKTVFESKQASWRFTWNPISLCFILNTCTFSR